MSIVQSGVFPSLGPSFCTCDPRVSGCPFRGEKSPRYYILVWGPASMAQIGCSVLLFKCAAGFGKLGIQFSDTTTIKAAMKAFIVDFMYHLGCWSTNEIFAFIFLILCSLPFVSICSLFVCLVFTISLTQAGIAGNCSILLSVASFAAIHDLLLKSDAAKSSLSAVFDRMDRLIWFEVDCDNLPSLCAYWSANAGLLPLVLYNRVR